MSSHDHSPHRRGSTPSCPTVLSAYASMHLDTMGKIMNHTLAITLVCDIFLFLSSWSVSLLPDVGFATVFASLLLTAQTICVWLIVNNNRISALSFLAPTEYMVGIAVGITVGGSILAATLSLIFRNMSKCAPLLDSTQESENHKATALDWICKEHAGSMTAIWFWGGLVFWFNFCSSMLLAIGRHELTHSAQYERLGGPSMDDFEGHLRQAQEGLGTFPGEPISMPPMFAGDYSTIPEIRQENPYTPQQQRQQPQHQNQQEQQRTPTNGNRPRPSPSKGSSETAAFVTNV